MATRRTGSVFKRLDSIYHIPMFSNASSLVAETIATSAALDPHLPAMATHPARAALTGHRIYRDRQRNRRPPRSNLPSQLEHPGTQRFVIINAVPLATAFRGWGDKAYKSENTRHSMYNADYQVRLFVWQHCDIPPAPEPLAASALCQTRHGIQRLPS